MNRFLLTSCKRLSELTFSTRFHVICKYEVSLFTFFFSFPNIYYNIPVAILIYRFFHGDDDVYYLLYVCNLIKKQLHYIIHMRV